MNQDKEINIKVLHNKTNTNMEYNNIVEMDYDNFGKKFKVVSDDKIRVYQLLTLDVMELLLEYREKYGIEFDIVFLNNIIYYRLHTGAMFEAAMNENVMKKENFYKYYMSLNLIKELSEKIYKILSELE